MIVATEANQSKLTLAENNFIKEPQFSFNLSYLQLYVYLCKAAL